MRFVNQIVLLAVLLPAFAFAVEPKASRDIAYAGTTDKLQTLDVYSPIDAHDCPVLIWIHGGGWRQGDKAQVDIKPQAFCDKGYVLVSVNYRFVPQVTIKQMTADIAKSIKWTHEHAKEYGGSPDTLFVAGHSAGAHLAALVCTDESYLKAEGLPLSAIKGCIPVDGAAYDVPAKVKAADADQAKTATMIFGADPEGHKDLSPITHVAKDKGIPPFLLLHVASRPDSAAQSRDLAKKLQEAGVEAKVVPAENKTHGTINSELGKEGDPPTKAMFEFLDATKGTAGARR